MTGKLITVKFAADCRRCNARIGAGEKAIWRRGYGVTHEGGCGRVVLDPFGSGRWVSANAFDAALDDGLEPGYADGVRAAEDCEGKTVEYAERYMAAFKASDAFKEGWLDGMSASICPDGCCGHVAPGVVM